VVDPHRQVVGDEPSDIARSVQDRADRDEHAERLANPRLTYARRRF
jgi:hypothetical protein